VPSMAIRHLRAASSSPVIVSDPARAGSGKSSPGN
jgi:hypothetical protein